MFVWSTCLTFSGRLVSRSPMAVSCNLVCDIFIVFSIDLMSREAGATPITIFVVADLDSDVGLSLVQSVLSLIVCHGSYPMVWDSRLILRDRDAQNCEYHLSTTLPRQISTPMTIGERPPYFRIWSQMVYSQSHTPTSSCALWGCIRRRSQLDRRSCR